MRVEATTDTVELLGFCSGATEVSNALGSGAVSLGD
jgi:hypothetical protein